MEFDLAPWIAPAVVIAVFAWLRSDIHRVEARMNERMERMEKGFGEVKKELSEVRKELGAVVKDLAEMKGKLTFVEGYILRRNDSAPEPAAE